jgi:hypothetical protein
MIVFLDHHHLLWLAFCHLLTISITAFAIIAISSCSLNLSANEQGTKS